VPKYPDSPRWFSYVFDPPKIPYGVAYGTADYSKGLLEWTIAYDKTIDVLEFDYCGAYGGTATYMNYYGAYSDISKLPCAANAYYDRWLFTAAYTEDIHISIDTIEKLGAFDPNLVVTDASGCFIGGTGDGFLCTYPPTAGSCPGYEVPVTKGLEYAVIVQSDGSCTGVSGAYSISLDTKYDPGLTLAVDDADVELSVHVEATGTANL
jgi:hypothetical protein